MNKKIIVSVAITLMTFGALAQSTTASNWQNGGQTRYLGFANNRAVYLRTGGTNRFKINSSTGYNITGYNGARSGFMFLGVATPNNAAFYNVNTNYGAFSQLHISGRQGTFTQSTGYRPWMQAGVTFTDNQDLSYIGIRRVGSGFDRTEMTIAWADNEGNNSGPDDMVFRFLGNGNGNTQVVNNRNSVNDLDGRHIARFTPQGDFGLGPNFGLTNAGGGTQPTSNGGYNRPQSHLHMSSNNNTQNWLQITNLTGSGETQNDGLRLGIRRQALIPGGTQYLNGYLRWQEQTPFIIQTDWNGNPGGINNGERLRISSINAPGVPHPIGIANNTTRVSISYDGASPITKPRSLLHLGYNTGADFFNLPEDGWRPWMDVGMFVSNGTDNVYIGLKADKTNTYDRNDAVISWGDNQTNASTGNIGPDKLRFIFTSTNSPLTQSGDPISSSYDGLETMRIVPFRDTLGTYGRVGVGDFTSQGVNEEPTHKLDVVGNGRFRYLPDNIYMADDLVDKIVMVDSAGVLRWLDKDSLIIPVFACWDSNEDGIQDPAEDFNGDGFWNTLDCQGGTDDQIITNFALNGNNLTITIEDGNTVNVDMSQFLDNTDDQNLTSAILDPNTNILTISIENGNPVSVDLSSLINNANGDADWFDSANQGNVPTNINSNIYTFGNVGINQASGQQAQLHINNNNQTFDPFLINGTNARFHVSQGGGIGIGYSATNFPNGSLINATNTYLANTISHGINLQLSNMETISTGSAAAGVYVVNNSPNINGYGADGVHAIARGALLNSRGVFGGAIYSQSQNNYGGYFNGRLASDKNYGIYAIAFGNGSETFGVWAHGSGTATNVYGIKAYGGGTGINNWAGYFVGDVHATGQISSTNGTIIASDQQFKTNVNNLTNSLAIINQLQPKTFYYDTTGYASFSFETDQQMGLIAQDVEQVLPTIVSNLTRPEQFDTLGNSIAPQIDYKGVEYGELIPVLIGGIQEQQAIITTQDSTIIVQDSLINDLNARLTNLENCLSNLLPMLCQINNSMILENNEDTQNELRTFLNIELTDGESIVLEQNVPNPFAEQTTISYTIPTTVQKAQIHFYNQEGKLIKTVDIDERGNGQINVFGSDLSSGIYTYTLVADGKVVATKRMVKTY